jgi:hypothetical protein
MHPQLLVSGTRQLKMAMTFWPLEGYAARGVTHSPAVATASPVRNPHLDGDMDAERGNAQQRLHATAKGRSIALNAIMTLIRVQHRSLCSRRQSPYIISLRYHGRVCPEAQTSPGQWRRLQRLPCRATGTLLMNHPLGIWFLIAFFFCFSCFAISLP